MIYFLFNKTKTASLRLAVNKLYPKIKLVYNISHSSTPPCFILTHKMTVVQLFAIQPGEEIASKFPLRHYILSVFIIFPCGIKIPTNK